MNAAGMLAQLQQLVHRDAGEVGGCWGLAARLLAAAGFRDVPATPAEALARSSALADEVPAGEACRACDLLVIDRPGAQQHVAVAISAFSAAHCLGGKLVEVHGISVLRRAGRVRVLRVREVPS